MTTAVQELQSHDDIQVVRMCNERFSVTEVLFHPNDIGIHQAGVVETIIQAASLAPAHLKLPLSTNILLSGGSTLLPGFKERLERDLLPLLPPLTPPLELYINNTSSEECSNSKQR